MCPLWGFSMAEIELGSMRGSKPRKHAAEQGNKTLAQRRAANKKKPAAKPNLSERRSASKANEKKLPATADDRAKRLAQLKAEADAVCDGVVERFDAGSEEAQQLNQYRHMFDELIEISTILETNIRNNRTSRDVYPLMQTYNQMREVIADMRALRDLGKLGDRVNEELIYPMVQSIGQDIAQFYQDLHADIRRLLPPHEAEIIMTELGTQFSGLGSKIKLAYDQCLDKSARVLGS